MIHPDIRKSLPGDSRMKVLFVILELAGKLDPLASYSHETLVINVLNGVSGCIIDNFRKRRDN